MIRYIEGKLKAKTKRGIVVLANGVGYEIELPPPARRLYAGRPEDDGVKLYISYQATQQQPVPRLFGFPRELERDFFEELIVVSGIGGPKALDAMSMPIPQIARAIVDQDANTLRSLKGIGEATADNMVAQLKRKVAKYALLPEDAATSEPPDFKIEVRETLVKQLGFKSQEAQRLIDLAMKENSAIKSAEELFDEVLRLHK